MTENDCTRVFECFSEYLDHELPPGTCEELEKHLRVCPQCLRFVRSVQESVQLCHEIGAAWRIPPASPQATDHLREAYEEMLSRRRNAHR